MKASMKAIVKGDGQDRGRQDREGNDQQRSDGTRMKRPSAFISIPVEQATKLVHDLATIAEGSAADHLTQRSGPLHHGVGPCPPPFALPTRYVSSDEFAAQVRSNFARDELNHARNHGARVATCCNRARSSAGSTAFQAVERRERSRSRERHYLDAPEGSRLGATHLQDLILEYTNELVKRVRESSNEAGGP
jgi:hypothetical protein